MDKVYYKYKDIKIVKDNSLYTKEIPNSSIDLIVTSPPYNVKINYNSHNDSMDYDKYLEFNRKWLINSYEWLKDDGRLCLNIPLTQNKFGHNSLYADIVTIAKDIGLKFYTTIIWDKNNISKRTAWGSWMSASAPFIIPPVEVIAVFYKKSYKKRSGSRISDMTKEEFIEWTMGTWRITGENSKRVKHPAPFPRELAKRCIKLFSFAGDTILDPFCGSGTTLIEAFLLNRKGIGIEIDKKYCSIAKDRFITTINQEKTLF